MGVLCGARDLLPNMQVCITAHWLARARVVVAALVHHRPSHKVGAAFLFRNGLTLAGRVDAKLGADGAGSPVAGRQGPADK